MNEVFSVEGVGVSIGCALLLSGVSFSLMPNEIVALEGRSGLGKTTLLRVLAQLRPAHGGEIRVHGRTPELLGYPAYRRRVVYVAQQPQILDSSVKDNLERPFAFASTSGAYPADKAAKMLEQVGLGDIAPDHHARELSVGQQQRLCLVRALLLEPWVVLLDEPTSSLDVTSRNAIEALLWEHAAGGMVGLVVTHDADQAKRLCDRRLDASQWAA